MNMNFKQSVILFVMASLWVMIVASDNVLPKQDSNTNLLNVMARSNDLMRKAPSRSKRCFEKYLPHIDEIIEEYEISYEDCEKRSGEEQLKAGNATLDIRNSLSSTADKACHMLSQCNKMATVELIFNCYVVVGLEAAKIMYDIEINALEGLSNLRQKLSAIKDVEYKCTNDTQKQHDEECVQTYADLHECILGFVDETTTTESPKSTKEPEAVKKSEAPKNPESATRSRSSNASAESFLPKKLLKLQKS